MLIDIVLVVIAGAVFAWMVSGRSPSVGRDEGRVASDDVGPNAPTVRDRRAAPDPSPGLDAEPPGPHTFRTVARSRLSETVNVEVRAGTESYPARVLDYSVDGSGLSVLGKASVQRGDRVQVRLREAELEAEVCHPIGKVAKEEWVVGLFFPDHKDRRRVLQFIRDLNGDGVSQAARELRSPS